jgi:hypothetical protein
MRPGPDGASQLDHWRYAAKRGNKTALAKLQAPPFPEALTYLWVWAMELVGKSGVSTVGINGLTYTTIAHWSELTDQKPTPREVSALMKLDAALRDVNKPEPEQVEPAEIEPWPEQKSG